MGPRRLPVVASSGVPAHGGTTPLPPLHARWLDGMLGAATPPEVDATCDDCVMCRPPPEGASWAPDVRCCSYLPHLPNFLLGAALTDASVRGRASVEARIAEGGAISPLGAAWTEAFDVAWKEHATRFGRDRALRCPHYVDEGGLCGIWKYRNAVCATYFCRVVRDGHGHRFWDAARLVLQTIEHDLARACLRELGVDEREWGPWEGRVTELYRACFAFVAPLSWPDVATRCRPALAAEIEALRKLHAVLVHPRVPLVVRLAKVRSTPVPHDPSMTTVMAEGRMSGVLADEAMRRVLARFDGRPVPIVRRALAKEGLFVDLPTLQRLVDLGILVEP